MQLDRERNGTTANSRGKNFIIISAVPAVMVLLNDTDSGVVLM
jgi:hypothetical protein